MRRLGVVCVVVVALAAAFGTTWTAPAGAFVEPPVAGQPFNTATTAELMTALQTSRATTDMTAYEAAFVDADAQSAKRGASRAARAARVMPALRVLGTIGLGVAAFELGWKTGTIFTKLVGLDNAAPSGSLGAVTWRSVCSSDCTLSTISNGTGGTYAGPGWQMHPTTGPDGGWSDPYNYSGNDAGQMAVSALANSLLPTVTRSNPQTANPYRALTTRTDAQQETAYDSEPISSAEYTAMGANVRDTGTYTEPTHDAADATAARAALTAGSEDARTYVNWILDPGYELEPEEDDPMTLPAPEYGETATAYRDRLIAAGALGTITITTLSEDAAVAALGALAPVRINTAAGTTTITAPTSPFPAAGSEVSPWTAPEIEYGSDIEIEANPSTIPPYGELPGAGDDDCPCPVDEIDFSPLAGIEVGDAFPFGVFGFFGDILDHFNVAPEAPGWDMNVEGLAVDYEGDLSVFDSHMSVVRSLISVVLWIGALYFLATRLLGFNAGGDPGEASDDGSYV